MGAIFKLKQEAALQTAMRLKDLATTTKTVYSRIEFKAFDEDKREFTGIATTPSTDRMGDIVEPMGAEFELPIPLIWMHDRALPIGTVFKAKPTKAGIEVTCRIAKVESPPGLVARLDEAWQSLKADLVRGLSIGFSAIEYAWMDNGGIHFTKWNWLELSLVTIPANADCSVTSIKSFYESAAPLGTKALPVVKTTAGVPAKPVTIKPTPPEGNLMNYAKMIADFQAAKVLKQKELEALVAKDASATLDDAGGEAFDTLQDEIEAIDKHIARLEGLQRNAAAVAQKAQPVVDNSGMGARKLETGNAVAKVSQKLEPGIAFARAAKCLALGFLERRDGVEIAKALYAGQESVIKATTALITKAAVAVGTSTDATWAGPLVGDETNVFADFIEYLRPQTILGRFGQGNVPSLRRIPFRVPLIGQTSGGSGYWVGEGRPKPVTKFDFNRTTLEPLKVANIAVLTMETVRDSSPSADVLIRDGLAAALIERLDIDFIDPDKAAVAGISPASILNGVSAIIATGTGDADDIRKDIQALFGVFIAANNAPTNGVWLMSAVTALALSQMKNPLGQSEFPGINMNGGTFEGLPVIVSQYFAADSNGGFVALINASDIYLADEGGIQIDMSTEASLQMNDAPDYPTTASTVMVSLWQNNLVGFRAERTINWARRRAGSVAYLAHVRWGQA
jgi:HK97 family phage major capsid protein/HK97 family phage prohead protease